MIMTDYRTEEFEARFRRHDMPTEQRNALQSPAQYVLLIVTMHQPTHAMKNDSTVHQSIPYF